MSNSERQPNYDTGPRRPKKAVEYDRWVCWRYEGDKKPPFDPDSGEYASVTDPNTWSDYGSALRTSKEEEYDGIGFVLTEDGPFTGFDFDNCRDSTAGEIAPEILGLIHQADSYTELSPSKTGLHTLVIGEKPDGFAASDGDHIEVYDSGRYFTVTGNHLTSTPETIEKRDDFIRQVCETYLPNQTNSGTDPLDEENDFSLADRPTPELVDAGELTLRTLQEMATPAFDATMSFLQGKIKDGDEDGIVGGFTGDKLTKDDNRVNRDAHDAIALSLLYGALRQIGDYEHSRAVEIATATYTHYCREHPRIDDGQPRRWLNDSDQYREKIITGTLRSHDPAKYRRFLNRGENSFRRERNEYAETTYKLAKATVEICCGADVVRIESQYHVDLTDVIDALEGHQIPPTPSKDMTPPSGPTGDAGTSSRRTGSSPASECPYPTVGEVVEILVEADRNSEGTYRRNVLPNLREDGYLKLICMKEGVDYRLCRPHDPEPPSADFVRYEGEERAPISGLEPLGEETEGDMMTDGGTRSDDTEDNVDKPSHTTEDLDGLGRRSPAVFACPIKGCSRIVIDNPGDLRNHVAQETDEAHRYRTLDEDLDVVVRWEAMDWGWGTPE